MIRGWGLIFVMAVVGSISASAQTFIYQKNSLRVEITVSNPCNGTLSNGTIIFRATGSGSGFARIVLISGPVNTVFPELNLNTTNANTYAYSPPAPQTGVYEFIVRDPFNDSDVINTFSTEFNGVAIAALTPPVLQATSLVNNSDCTNPNGQVIAEVTGGSRSPALSVPGSFEYNWTADVSVQGLAYFNVFDGSTPLDLAGLLQVGGLPAGNYTLTVKDVYTTCTTAQIFTIADDFPAVQNLSVPIPPVCGAQSVNLLLDDSEGSDVTYEVFKDGTATGITATGTGNPLTITIPGSALTQEGTFTFTVRATKGICQPKFMAGSAVLNIPPAVTLSNSNTDPSCPLASDGAVSLSATGGTAPYQFSIDQGATYQLSGNFTGLAAGTFKVYGKDVNGCLSLEGLVTLTDPQPVAFTSIVNDPLCTGNTNGSIILTGSGGNGTFQYSINNGTTFQTSGTFSNLAPGTFNVVVTDGNNCSSASGSLVLNDPTPVSSTASGTSPACANANTGLITFTPAGGTGTYLFSVNNGSTFNASNPITGLAAGTYTLVIRDSNGCTASAGTVNLTAPSAVTITTSKTEPTCNGQNDGTITLTGGGGTGPYTFSVNNGSSFQSSANFIGLAPGSYQSIVKDSQGCLSSSSSVTLTNPSSVTRTATAIAVSCNGGADGSISLTATGGSGGYNYSIDNGTTFVSTSVFSSLLAGSYPVVVRDSKGCLSAPGSVAVSEPALVTFTAVIVDPGCTGASTGSITLTASGGNGGFTYSINNGSSYQASTGFSGLAAGNYTALVKDSKNCLSATQTLTITNPSAVTATTASTAPTCTTSNNGIITITASGGAGGYTYSINNGSTFNATNPVTGLSPGTYQIIAKDSKGCVSSASSVIITPPAAVTLASTTTQPLCSGTLTGTITITGAGGTGTFTYSINGGTAYQASNTFTSLGAGSYVLRVRDSNNCTSATTNVALTSPSQVNVTASSNPTDCSNNATGSITLTGSGGTGSYSYSINNGTSFTSSGVFGSLAGGAYTVLAKDANGCLSTSKSVTVTQPSPVTFTTTSTAPTCNGGNTGSIVFSASGGNSIFTYSVNNGTSFSGGSTVSNLAAGTYALLVKDGKGCLSAPGSVTLTDPAQVTFTATPTAVACLGNTNGSIAITASGGNNTFTYSINNGTSFVAGSTFSNLAAGNYTVVVKDGKGCLSASAVSAVTSPAAVTFTTANVQETCNNQGDGSITITASGGNGTYTYSINNGSAFGASAAFNGLAAGTYNVVVKDNKGCLSGVSSVALASRPAVTFTFTQTAVTTCSPGNEGTITLTAAGGSGSYSYSINNGSTTQPASSFTGLSAGSFSLIVRDLNNCVSAVQQANLAAPAGISATQTNTAASCSGFTDGTVVAQGSGGDNAYTYSIDNGINYQNSNIFGNLAAGTYTITVRDGRLCSTAVTANISQPPVLDLSIGSTDITCNGANDGIITLSGSGGNGGYAYTIDNASTLTASGNFSGLAPGTYQVTLQDNKGCTLPAVSKTLIEPTALVLTSSHVDVTSCTGNNDGSISMTASGGTGSLQFSIDQVTYSAASNYTSLAAGIYNVSARDANSCVTTGTETINSSNGPSLTFTTTGLTCYEDSSGAITITGSGGSGALEYSINGGTSYQSGGSFSSLAAGDFPLRVRDGGGCTFLATATVSQPDVVGATATATGISCNGLTDGKINLSATGGSGVFEYALSGTSAFQASPLFIGLSAGAYNPIVRDNNGCLSAPASATVIEPTALGVSLTSTNPGCSDNDGTVRVATLSGGTTPYTFKLNSTAVTALPANNTFTGLTSGNYAVEVTDANLCTKLVSATITFPGNITASTIPTDPDCSGNGDNGRIVLNINSAGSFQAGISTSPTLPPAEYTPVSSTGTATTNFTGLTPGTYYLHLNESVLCPFRSTIVINPGPVPLSFNLSATDQKCFEDAGKLVLSSITGAAGLPYTFVITDGSTTVLNRTITSAEAGGVLNLQVPGQGSFQARLLQDQSSVNGCITPIQTGLSAFAIDGSDAPLDTLSTNLSISLPDLPTGQLSGIVSESGAEPYESKLVLTTPAFPDQQFSTDFSTATRDDQTTAVGFAYQNLFAGVYTLTLRDGLGCEKNFVVSIAADPSLFIPNIFTPNSDGVNDTFYVRNLPAATTLVVTNRWGKQVYASNSYNNSWEGQGQPDGIYYYRIVISGKTYTGWMELLRGK